MSDAVRARLKNGRETNLSPYFAELYGAEVLDEPTETPDGQPRRDTAKGGRPLKPRTTVEESSTAKKAVTSASEKKEKDQ